MTMAATLSFPDFAGGAEARPAPRFTLRSRERPLRVLIVDDEPMIVRLAESILQRTGCEMMTASDPEQALEIGHTKELDVLVTDLAMPGLNGEVLAERLRELLPDLKVLYMTGFAGRLFEQRLLLAPHEAYLQKPFTSAGLLEAVSLLAHGRLPAHGRHPRPVRQAG
jgi:CheY-like chemotaxis protein